MNLQPGTVLSHYRLAAKIGEGGMGEVWKATDTTLERSVAIKILPEAFAEDPERVARFEREAKLLASLNHPNIAVIHGLHRSDGVQFLAMELVEGEDLAQRIKRGALPLDEAVAVARQVAEALEAAHESGVIHRDLKPANIQITPEGKVKVLDFGLAKAFETESKSGNPSLSPTLTSAGTRAGVILGTAAYMSPEQARGRPVDRRADIWAFGCVLFEMLTGTQPFTGETVSDTLAAVLKTEPDGSLLPEETPPPLRRLLRRCLVKDPKERLRDIGEARILLGERQPDPEIGSEAAAIRPSTALGKTEALRRLLPWLLAAILAAALAGTWLFRSAAGPQPLPGLVRLKVELSRGGDLPGNVGLGAATLVSPDGRVLAFIAQEGATRRLFVRRLDRSGTVALSGTEGARAPFFSPDGRWIAFFSSEGLMKVGTEGGAPQRITEIRNAQGRGGTWSEEGVIVYAPGFDTGLLRIQAAGGKPEPLTRLTPGSDERSHRWPSFLPGGQAVLFMTQRTGQDYDDADVEVVSLGTGARKVVLHGGSYPRFAPGGWLLFARENVLFAAPFDLAGLEVTGPARPVIPGVLASTGDQESADGSAQYDLSASGILLYREAGIADRSRESTLVWVDREGRESPAFQEAMRVLTLEISPDGTRVAMEARTDRGVGVWIRDLQRGASAPLATDGDGSTQPVWSPDGRRLARCWRPRGGQRTIRIQAVDGAGPERDIPPILATSIPQSWSPDGKTLLVVDYSAANSEDIWALPLEGGGKPTALVESPGSDAEARFSPDGRWYVYMSDDSGTFQVYAAPFPGPGPRWQVSTSGGGQARWSRDGREIYFVSPVQNHLMEVPVQESGGKLQVGVPREVYPGWLGSHPARPVYDEHPDGKRFLLLKRQPQMADTDSSHVMMVFGWLEELKRKMREE